MDISEKDMAAINEVGEKLNTIRERISAMTPNIQEHIDNVKLKALIKVMYGIHQEWPKEVVEQVEEVLGELHSQV